MSEVNQEENLARYSKGRSVFHQILSNKAGRVIFTTGLVITLGSITGCSSGTIPSIVEEDPIVQTPSDIQLPSTPTTESTTLPPTEASLVDLNGEITVSEVIYQHFEDLAIDDIENIRNDPDKFLPAELLKHEFGREVGLIFTGARYMELLFNLPESGLGNFRFFTNNDAGKAAYLTSIENSPYRSSKEIVEDSEYFKDLHAITVLTGTGTESIVYLKKIQDRLTTGNFKKPDDLIWATGADERLEMLCQVQEIEPSRLINVDQDWYAESTHGLMIEVVNSEGKYLGAINVAIHNAAIAWLVRSGDLSITTELNGGSALEYDVNSRVFGHLIDSVGITREEVLQIIQTGNIFDLQNLMLQRMGLDSQSIGFSDIERRWRVFNIIDWAWELFLDDCAAIYNPDGSLDIDATIQPIFGLIDTVLSEM